MKLQCKMLTAVLFCVAMGIMLPIQGSLFDVPQVQATETKTLTVFHSLQDIFDSESFANESFGIERVTIKPGQKVADVVRAKELNGYTFYKMGVIGIGRVPTTYEEIGTRNTDFYFEYRPAVLPPITIHLSHVTDNHVELGYERVTVQPGETVTFSPKVYEGYAYRTSGGRNTGLTFTYDELTENGDELKLIYSPAPSSATASVYRLYDRKTSYHFYTSNSQEVELLKSRGWNLEGTAWKVSTSKEGNPIYRVWNTKTGERIYTRHWSEVEKLVGRGWKNEGIAFYSKDQGKPIYRLRNKRTGKYLLTLHQSEVAKLVAGEWQNEGVAWYSEP